MYAHIKWDVLVFNEGKWMDRKGRHKTGCEFLDSCGFFKKFGNRKSNVWKGLVGFYCHAKGGGLCERRKIFRARGAFPDDGVMPTGDEIPQVFLILD